MRAFLNKLLKCMQMRCKQMRNRSEIRTRAHPNPEPVRSWPPCPAYPISMAATGRISSVGFSVCVCVCLSLAQLAFFAFKFAHLFKLFICQFSIYANFQVPAINSCGLFNPFKGVAKGETETQRGSWGE